MFDEYLTKLSQCIFETLSKVRVGFFFRGGIFSIPQKFPLGETALAHFFDNLHVSPPLYLHNMNTPSTPCQGLAPSHAQWENNKMMQCEMLTWLTTTGPIQCKFKKLSQHPKCLNESKQPICKPHHQYVVVDFWVKWWLNGLYRNRNEWFNNFFEMKLIHLKIKIWPKAWFTWGLIRSNWATTCAKFKGQRSHPFN